MRNHAASKFSAYRSYLMPNQFCFVENKAMILAKCLHRFWLYQLKERQLVIPKIVSLFHFDSWNSNCFYGF